MFKMHTRTEAAAYLGISRMTLYRWEKFIKLSVLHLDCFEAGITTEGLDRWAKDIREKFPAKIYNAKTRR